MDYPITPVSAGNIRLTPGFWERRIQTNLEVTVPHVLGQCEATGRIRNFIRAAETTPGPWCSDYPYDDSDVYKCIEGAARAFCSNPSSELESRLDTIIAHIADAQEDDGYLYPFARFEFVEDAQGRSRDWWYGPERWEKVHLHSHELYNVGHLYESAVAHFESTGKKSLLRVAIRNADLVAQTFGTGPGQLKRIPGHQEIELGLIRLYRLTGEHRFLRTADFFISNRGKPGFGMHGGEYWQNHKPVTEQKHAVGHAVRAAYMYSAMAELGILTGQPAYLDAVHSIWEDIVSTKLYITGGIGSTGEGEGFQEAFVLPNDSAYCETCAGIANVLWNHRMFLIHGDAKYFDVLERTLFNNILAGISLGGDSFFYPNPLETEGGYQRTSWFGCACCPSNMVRFIPQVPGYAYAQRGGDVFINLFLNSRVSVTVRGTRVPIRQETDYPWSGHVRIVVDPKEPVEMTLRVRIPGWARNQPVPSDLYTYIDANFEAPSIGINGQTIPCEIEDGYAIINRLWKTGDLVDISFDMPVRYVRSNDNVVANRGRIAIERGPIVYAVEQEDNEIELARLRVTPDARAEAVWEPGFLNGVISIYGTESLGGKRPFKAIPYYAWANRESGAMRVWIGQG